MGLGKASFILFVSMMLQACNIALIVDGQGRISSSSGTHDCSDTCEFAVDDPTYTEVFTAVPDEGYEFVGWQQTCRASGASPCVLIAIEELMDLGLTLTFRAKFQEKTTSERFYLIDDAYPDTWVGVRSDGSCRPYWFDDNFPDGNCQNAFDLFDCSDPNQYEITDERFTIVASQRGLARRDPVPFDPQQCIGVYSGATIF